MSSDAYSVTSASSAGGLAVPPTGLERLSVAASHGGLVIGIPFLLPLAILLLFPLLQPASAYVRGQALQALMFHAFVLLVSGVMGAIGWFFLAIVLIGWPFAIFFFLLSFAVFIWGGWFSLVAMVRGFQGQPYRLPLVGGWAA